MSSTDIATISSAVFAGIAALIAAGAIYVPWNNQRNQELLNQAVLSLERAYRTLSNEGRNIAPPPADRLNWLTAARHILSYRALKSRIKTALHRSLCEEHEEYWRHQFYLCLNMGNNHSPAYYQEGPPPERRINIDPRSALIVHSMASWPEGKADPIDLVDIPALIKEFNPLHGNIGLREYINTFPHLRDGA